MKRFTVLLTLLLLGSIVVVSCGPPPDGGETATVRSALTVKPVRISDLPTANKMAVFFRPELASNLKEWPDPVKRINAITEWTRDFQASFRKGDTGRPFFYRAEFLFNHDERWDLTTRSLGATLAVLINHGFWYSSSKSFHEGDDWNRYGHHSLNRRPSNALKYCNYMDYGAPMTSVCKGVLMYNQHSRKSFGRQTYVLCKFAAPWRTRSNGIGALIDGYELVAFKASHLKDLAKQNVGSTVNLGDDLGTVGGSGTKDNSWCPHIHTAFHRETMLMRCDSSGREKSDGDHICPRAFNGSPMETIWPASAYASDKGYSFIRDNYYDPLELIKARSGKLWYSARLKTSNARGSELEAFRLNGIRQAQTIVISLNNRDLPTHLDKSKRPPLSRIVILKGKKQVFAGAEGWNDRDKRAVLRDVQPGEEYTVKVLIKNRTDSYKTIANAHFQLFISGFQQQQPVLGHYGHNGRYPVLPRRSGMGKNLGLLYLNNKASQTADHKNNLRLLNYLKVAFDNSLLTCQSRYNCDYNRLLTRCDVIKKIATFANFEVDQSPIVNPFSDLKGNDDCFKYALAAYKNKVILRPQNSTGQFAIKPHVQADRATAVTMLVRALWGEPTKTLPSRFSDVSPSSWYNPYFTKAYDQKLLNGCGGGKACPTEKVPEAHLLIMLMRQMGLDDSMRVSTGTYSAISQKMVDRGGAGGGYCAGCSCTAGQTAPCGTNVGACKTGTVSCVDGKWDTAQCKGEVKPTPEDCDGIDNDCDGQIDNVKGTTTPITKNCSFPDCGTQGVQTCTQGGWSTCSAKACNLGPQCVDKDKDGYGDGPDCIAKDCDDNNLDVNPRQYERCNGQDDDCDGKIDNLADGSDLSRGCAAVPCGTPGKQLCDNGSWRKCDAPKCPDPCIDKDNDGYFANPSSHCHGPKDCDDSNAAVHPFALEDCDQKDNDCDGHVDNIKAGDAAPLTMYCFKPPCQTKVPIRCLQGKWELCTVQKCPQCIDQDGDGQKIGGPHCGTPDCNDNDSNVKAGAPELCNKQDDDCDGRQDNVPGSDDPITRKCSLNCGADGLQTCQDGKWSACKGACLPCKDEDGDGYKTGSPYCSPIDCDDKDVKVHPQAKEECNGKDDDCDGYVDNISQTEPLKKVCTNSSCGSKGIQTCAGGQWSNCSAQCKCEDSDKDGYKIGGKHCGLQDCDDKDADKSPFGFETCDGKDNDCNGRVDDGIKCLCQKGYVRPCYSGPAGSAGKGICRNGTQSCIPDGAGGTKWDACTGAIGPAKEVCNGQDDNCDGLIDNGITCGCKPGTKRACGGKTIGECRAGSQTCDSNGKWTACIGAIGPKVEVCDGKDNNCDGKVDEAVTKICYNGDPKHAGVGICVRGYQKCTNGKWSSICYGEIKPMPEVCDGADNDCNGKVDDDPQTYKQLSRSCYTGPTGTAGIGICNRGTQLCAAGNWGVCQNEGRPSVESCNGKDDNCDGLIDNRAGTNQRLSQTCTRKPCGFSGIELCRNGQWDSATCSAPQCPVQSCTDADGDGYDGSGGAHCKADCNDSDRLVHPGALEVCDGKDNNCDGKIDVDASGKPVTQLCYLSPCNHAGTQTCDLKTQAWGACSAKACPICIDADGDGYGKNGASDCQYPGKKDCDDSNSQVNPGGKEVCDGKDNNCDGYVDNQTPGSPAAITGNCAIAPCGNPGTRTCTNGSWGACGGTKCIVCGDGTCSKPTENCFNCSQDCGCKTGYKCSNNQCVQNCTCDNRQCGPDSCGQGSCGRCPDSRYVCSSSGQCSLRCGNGTIENGEDCSSCPQDASCSNGKQCVNGKCITCSCTGKQCGDDGCGKNCGAWQTGYSCDSAGKCVPPTNPCSNCTSNQVCYNNACCTKQCSGKQCGNDGCGGDCGTCPGGYGCSSGQCVRNGSCPDNICQSYENQSTCCLDCGCPSGQKCDGQKCIPNPPACNCSSWQYCDNGTCKPYYKVQVISGGCKTTNGRSLCLASSASRCTSSSCDFDLSPGNGSWRGNTMKLVVKAAFNNPSGCAQIFAPLSTSSGSTNKIKVSASMSCLTSVGTSADFFGVLYDPATCAISSCEYETGQIRITRLK